MSCAIEMENSSNSDTSAFPLLELPLTVVDKLISFLPPRTILTLRRVCKTTCDWVTQQSCSSEEIEKWRNYCFRITGKAPRTFSTVVKMNLPITLFNLQEGLNKQKIYDSEGVNEFIERFKHRKVRLFVHALSMIQTTREQAFYSSFRDISELQVCKLQACLPSSVGGNGNISVELLHDLFMRPPLNMVSSLRVLSIIEYERCSMQEPLSDELLLIFIASFKNLESLAPPSKLKKLSRRNFLSFFTARKLTYCPTWMETLSTTIITNDWRATQNTSQDQQFELCIDLRAFAKGRYYHRFYRRFIQRYLELLQESHRRGYLLRYVSSTALDSNYAYQRDNGLSKQMIRNSFKFLDNVVSLYNVRYVLRYGFSEMKRLEDITIHHYFANNRLLNNIDPPELSWDSLKSLMVSVYIPDEIFSEEGRWEMWDLTFRRLFQNTKRSSVTSLSLTITAGSQFETQIYLFNNPVFDAKVITGNFTSLKSLTIHGCPSPREYFRKLFAGLPNLTFLNVAACKWLTEQPFQELKSVKTLILHLDKMPRIKESFFTNVLCHMPLEEFKMTAKIASSHLTTRAIVALQEGTFGRTIEKFPHNTWKSKAIKEKEKMLLWKGFRFMK